MTTAMQLVWTTNNAYDTILLVSNGRVVNETTIYGRDGLREMLACREPGNWDGVTPDEDHRTPEDYGEIVATADATGVTIEDRALAERRADFWRVELPDA